MQMVALLGNSNIGIELELIKYLGSLFQTHFLKAFFQEFKQNAGQQLN